MKKFLSLLILTLAVFLLFSATCFASGLTFTKGDYYSLSKPFDSLPLTFEATVNFPSTLSSSDRGGVVLGNYDGSNACINFEFYTNGSPRYYIRAKDKTVFDIKFDKIKLYTGKTTHVAIVNDVENGIVHCYIDGVLKQSVECQTYETIPFVTSMNLGGDKRPDNSMYCKAKIFDVAAFDYAKTAEQILNDYQNGYTIDNGMLAYFDLSGYSDSNKPSYIPDLSKNSNNCSISQTWIKDIPLPDDFAYSFAVVGDTQILNRAYPMYMTNIYDWIKNNAEKNKLKFVFGLGDITDTDSDAEWSLAKAVIQKLDGVVPYSLVRGNHDKVPNFNKYLPYSEYESRLSGSFDGTMLNTYQFLTVNNIKYLIFSLDYGPSDDVLSWASEIISNNPDSNVIITTHAYLYRDGTTLDANDVCPPSTSGGYNNGDHMWDKLIKKHKNIVLVLSGHDPSNTVVLTQTKGEAGNTVSQMLIDPQGTDSTLKGAGLVAMLYFSADGKKVDVRYYSTVRNMYFMGENQFSFNMDVIESQTSAPVEPEMEIKNISFDVCLTADKYEGKVICAIYDAGGNMKSVVSYNAAPTVEVSLPANASGTKVKVFWWNGIDTIMPICTENIINITN